MANPVRARSNPGARVFPDAVVHAQAGQERAAEDENDGNGARKFIALQSRPVFEHKAEKLTETADPPAHDKGAVTRLEMLGRSRKRLDVFEIILIGFQFTFLHCFYPPCV